MLADSEQSAELADVLATLPERLQLVLQLYFVEELNLAEIAAVLEVSIPRVHQLKAEALKRSKAALEGDHGSDRPTLASQRISTA